MQSETISELAKALATAQGKFKPAKRSATNPALRNKYATLDDVIEAVRGPLSEHGLAFVQVLGDDGEDAHTLTTTLYHESGEWIGSTSRVPTLPTNKATNKLQMLGSALTYMRRYALSSLLGVSTGDGDDDGNGQKSAPKRTAKKKAAQPKPTPAKKPPLITLISLEDAKALVIKGKELGDASKEQLGTMLNWALDNPDKEASEKLGKACEILLKSKAKAAAAKALAAKKAATVPEVPALTSPDEPTGNSWFEEKGTEFVEWAAGRGDFGVPEIVEALSAAEGEGVELDSISATSLTLGEAKTAVDAYIKLRAQFDSGPKTDNPAPVTPEELGPEELDIPF